MSPPAGLKMNSAVFGRRERLEELEPDAHQLARPALGDRHAAFADVLVALPCINRARAGLGSFVLALERRIDLLPRRPRAPVLEVVDLRERRRRRRAQGKPRASHCGSISDRSVKHFTPSTCFGRRLQPSTLKPSGSSRRAASVPSSPRPSRPTVRSARHVLREAGPLAGALLHAVLVVAAVPVEDVRQHRLRHRGDHARSRPGARAARLSGSRDRPTSPSTPIHSDWISFTPPSLRSTPFGGVATSATSIFSSAEVVMRSCGSAALSSGSHDCSFSISLANRMFTAADASIRPRGAMRFVLFCLACCGICSRRAGLAETEEPSTSSPASRRRAPPISSRAWSRPGWARRSARRCWSRTSPAPAATSPRSRRSAPRPTATRSTSPASPSR